MVPAHVVADDLDDMVTDRSQTVAFVLCMVIVGFGLGAQAMPRLWRVFTLLTVVLLFVSVNIVITVRGAPLSSLATVTPLSTFAFLCAIDIAPLLTGTLSAARWWG